MYIDRVKEMRKFNQAVSTSIIISLFSIYSIISYLTVLPDFLVPISTLLYASYIEYIWLQVIVMVIIVVIFQFIFFLGYKRLTNSKPTLYLVFILLFFADTFLIFFFDFESSLILPSIGIHILGTYYMLRAVHGYLNLKKMLESK